MMQPRHSVTHACIYCDSAVVESAYDPCHVCSSRMALGITLIGVTEQPTYEGQQPISSASIPLYPTGAWLVTTKEVIEKYVTPLEMAQVVLFKRKAYVPMQIIELLDRYDVA